MKIKNVTVAGTGVLGSQIAFQTAFMGFGVSSYDINDEALNKAKERFKTLKERYVEDDYGTQEEVDAAYNRISLHSDCRCRFGDRSGTGSVGHKTGFLQKTVGRGKR